MYAVSFVFPGAPDETLRGIIREEHFRPPTEIGGLRLRHWSPHRRKVLGRYLFRDESSVNAFVGNPADHDPVVRRIAAHLGRGPQVAGTIEAISRDPLERPIFIVSAPRAGSTLLFECLTAADRIWSIRMESSGVIEGIAALNPAARGFETHRLTGLDASEENREALRYGFIAELCDSDGRRLLDLPSASMPTTVRMLEKTPENALRIPFMLSCFPDASFIYLVRDVHENVSSIIHAWHHNGFVNIPALPGWDRGAWHMLLPSGWRAYNGRRIAHVAAFQWASANSHIIDDLKAVPKERWTAIDYSSLVRRPDETLRDLCTFLGLGFGSRLERLASRPLPLSATTVTRPLTSKWKYNRSFEEADLDEIAPVVDLVRGVPRLGN